MVNISRRWFIGGAVSFGAFQGCRFLPSALGLSGAPRLRFGVVSDIHVIAENTDRGEQGNTRMLRRALKWFDAQGADGVIIAGDMADAGLLSQLQCVADAWNAVFPDGRSRRDGRRVEKLFCYGNHDWEGCNYRYANIFGTPSAQLVNDHIRRFGVKRAWEEVFEEEYAPIYRKTINGYTFIGGHWDEQNGSGWGGGVDLAPFLAANRAEIDPGLPFFYFQHPHPKGTCYGDWAWGHDNGAPTRALAAFPNAIAFSGHSHYSLADERSVWQGEFTSIGTGSLRYAGNPCDEFAGGYENTTGGGKVRPDADKMMEPNLTSRNPERNGLFVTVTDEAVSVARRDFVRDCPLGPDWVMPLPSAEPKPFAFAAHARRSTAPQFPAGAQLVAKPGEAPRRRDYVGDEPKGSVPALIVTFPSAVQSPGHRVWQYEFVCEDAAGKPILTRRILSPDYHLPVSMAEKTITLPIARADLPENARLRLSVTPFNSLGKGGKPITLELEKV